MIKVTDLVSIRLHEDVVPHLEDSYWATQKELLNPKALAPKVELRAKVLL